MGSDGEALALGVVAPILELVEYEVRSQIWATGEEMKAVLVSVLIAFAAATALAYTNTAVTNGVAAVAVQVSGGSREPAIVLLSGGLLLGLAGAVKRFPL